MKQQRRGFKVLGLALVLGSAATMSGCSDDGGKKGGPSAAQSTGIFGEVTDTVGVPLAGATVRAGGRSATTDAVGRFELKASVGEVVVRVEVAGHLAGIKKATVAAGSPTALHLRLLAVAAAQPLDATAGGEIIGAASARVTVPAGGLVNAAGEVVGGTVQVHITPIDPSVPAQVEAAPGNFSARLIGGDPVHLESFGMIDLTIRQGTEKLQVAPGQRFQIAIPAPAGSAEPPATMPLWSFNEATGVWVEEGTLSYDAGTHTYLGEIAHMSYWNADVVIDTTCVSGKVVDGETGEPVAGSYIFGRGLDYFGTDTTHANADGRFALRVRKSSSVAVLAAHEAGGGQERSVQSGTSTAPANLSPDDPSCTDGGTWTVRRGSVRFADGTIVSCDASSLDKFANCIPFQVELATCFAPVGACTYEAGSLFSPNIVYENGARTTTAIDVSSGEVTITFTGPGGRACGTQTSRANGSGASELVTTLADGRSASYSARFDENTGDVNITCANGSSRSFTAADQAALAACSGSQSGDQECAGDPGGGGGGFGEACEADGSCPAGGECCAGICLPAGLCPIKPPCTGDAECENGEICCTTSEQCSTIEICRQSGGCRVDGDCAEGVCCEGECESQPFCEGDCTANAGCEGDSPYCCMESVGEGGYSFCSTDAATCWAYDACDAGLPISGQCGNAEGLVCCPGSDGSEDSCRTADDCFADQPCTGNAECGGGFICCQNAENGLANTCQSDAACDVFTPCAGAGAACPSDLFCCTESYLLSLDQPRCFESESTCNFYKPCAGSAECGGGSACCNITGDPAAALCYPTDVCPDDLELP